MTYKTLQQAAEELVNSIEQEARSRQAKAQALLDRLSAPPRYSPAELKFIDFLQRKCAGRPMSREEIEFQLDLAKTILGPDLTG